MVTLLFEASTPFMHARQLLISAKASDGPLFAATQVAFAGVFFACRIAYGLFACGRWWVNMQALLASGGIAQGHAPMVRMYQVLCTVLCGLNVFWFGQMVAKAFAAKAPKKMV